MAFDKNAFMRDKFKPRTGDVPVPELSSYFPDQKDAVWKVRGVSGVEMAECFEAAEKNKKIGAVIDGIASGQSKKTTDAIKEMVGASNNTPQDIAKRIAFLVIGSVSPKVDQELAKKLCQTFPIEFYQITTKIIALTGMGHEPGKPKCSGKAKK